MTIVDDAFAALPRSAWCGEGHPVPPLHIAPPLPSPAILAHIRAVQADRAAAVRAARLRRDAQIVAMRGDGVGIGAIASLLECSQGTVKRALREAQGNGA